MAADNSPLLPTEILWNTRDEPAWLRALDHYWHGGLIQPKNYELERKMAELRPDKLRALNGQEWYDFLHDEYFRWKYTGQHKQTSHLRRQFDRIGPEALLRIRDRILQAAEINVRDGLNAARGDANGIKGLGVAGASGLLSLLYPHMYGTVDQFVVYSLLRVPQLRERDSLLKMKPKNLTIDDAVLLIGIMADKAKELNQWFSTDHWMPRKIDMILWSSDRQPGCGLPDPA